jgi:hypothetical protein
MDGLPILAMSYISMKFALGCEKNVKHAHGCDASARLSGDDADNHCFAHPLGRRA